MKTRRIFSILLIVSWVIASSINVLADSGTQSKERGFWEQLAQDTWKYISSGWGTSNHLPWSWRSEKDSGGYYCNPAEIGFRTLSWVAAYEMKRSWSPSWAAVDGEVTAILDQLRAWQTGSQSSQPHGPNAYSKSVFYQWYWISWNPPVVGQNDGTNQVVPSVDNAWLAAVLLTIREYGEAEGHAVLAQKASAILQDMDFTIWYDSSTRRFNWGGVQDPKGGGKANYFSNENRIINFMARALGQLDAGEFQKSLDALIQTPNSYGGITVGRVAWDGAMFTYLAPGLFIKEADTAYGENTLLPAVQAQMAYATNEGYTVWGLSDCYGLRLEGYVDGQGAPPLAPNNPNSPEQHKGLITPYASALAQIIAYQDAQANLQKIFNTFPSVYDHSNGYGFRDSLMADPANSDYGAASDRFSELAQAWIFLSIVNSQTGFIQKYFYRDEGVARAHQEMYAEPPENLYLQNETVTDQRTYQATQTIVAGENVTDRKPAGPFVLSPGADITLKAKSVLLRPGFNASKGARLTVIMK